VRAETSAVGLRPKQQLSESPLFSPEDLSFAAEEEWEEAQEWLFTDPFPDPFTFLEGKELVEKLTAAIGELPERQRLVVTLYYLKELTLREIGEILGLTRMRIWQIRAQAIARLRPALADRAPTG
jgi:RNA polymerase sigma factor FliA